MACVQGIWRLMRPRFGFRVRYAGLFVLSYAIILLLSCGDCAK